MSWSAKLTEPKSPYSFAQTDILPPLVCVPVIFSDARHPFVAPLDFNFLCSHPSSSDCNYLISLPEAISFNFCQGEGLHISTKPLVICRYWRLSLDGAARQWQCPLTCSAVI